MCLQNVFLREAQTAVVQGEVHIQTLSKDQNKENLLQPVSTHSETRWISMEYVFLPSIKTSYPKGILKAGDF